MPIEISSLDTISEADVEESFQYLVQLLLERYPNLTTRRGVIGDLVLRLDSLLYRAADENIQRMRQSQSLAAIEADPTLADDDIVDNVLSNFRITRKIPTFALGEVTIVIDRLMSLAIPQDVILESNGKQYQPTETFTARTASENVLTENDRLLTQIGTDRYAFTINVQALEAGPESQAKKDSKFVPLVAPIGFVRAYATADFDSAIGVETNAEMLARLEQGMATRAVSNRITNMSLIRNAYNEGLDDADVGFENIVAMSFIGCDDPEMQRDQHWLWPSSGGGRVDLYARTQPLYTLQAIEVTATLIEKRIDGTVWQFSLGRDVAPGLYEVTKVNPEDDEEVSGYSVVELIRGVDLTGDDYVPDVVTAQEATFSRYQAVTVRFLDTDVVPTDLIVNTSTATYTATVAVMPLVLQLQTFLSNRDVIDPAGDILVKAAIPCFLAVTFELHRRRTTATIDEAAIQTAVAAYVNATGFVGKLYASELTAVIAELLPDRVSVGSIDMLGRILRPDGETQYVRSREVLTVPDVPAAYVSGRTVAFLLDPASVAITVVSDDVPEV